MSMIVLLDAGPLGMISNPNASIANRECYQWMESLILNGDEVLVPEIADYEVKRELLRAQKTRGIARLDILKDSIGYLPITTKGIIRNRPTTRDRTSLFAARIVVWLVSQGSC